MGATLCLVKGGQTNPVSSIRWMKGRDDVNERGTYPFGRMTGTKDPGWPTR